MDQLLQEPLPKLPENRTVPNSSSSSSASSARLEFNAFSNSLKSAQEVSAAFDLVIAQGGNLSRVFLSRVTRLTTPYLSVGW